MRVSRALFGALGPTWMLVTMSPPDGERASTTIELTPTDPPSNPVAVAQSSRPEGRSLPALLTRRF